MKLDPKALEAAAEHFGRADPDLGDYVRLQLAIATYLSNLQPSKEVRELVEPVAWLHEIIEPEAYLNQPQTLLSRSPNNPWSHWLEAHRDKCTYRVTPLYAADLLSRIDGEGWRPTHRHKKRGTEYTVLGVGKMQAEHWREMGWNDAWLQSPTFLTKVDMREVTVYRGDDGQLWVRPIEEFNDGRFEALAPSIEDPTQ